MANENAFPFDAQLNSDGSYDREFSSQDFASYFQKIMTNGVFPSVGDCLQVIAESSSMVVTVKGGAVFINGRVREWLDSQTFRISNSHATLDRYDVIVARLDLLNRNITLAVREGVASSSPVVPTLTKTDELFELGLARVHVRTGVTSLTNANITDLRDSDMCGYVTSMVGDDVEQALGVFLYGTSEDEIESVLDDILGV